MVKYIPNDTAVTFREIPDEVTLSINISNCQNNCKGCHSPYLREDCGEILDLTSLGIIMSRNRGVSCVCFMGEGNDLETIMDYAEYIKKKYYVKTALYSGRADIPESRPWQVFDYIKIGPYIEERGPLNVGTTNQKLYQKSTTTQCFVDVNGRRRQNWHDITFKFWMKAF